MQRFGSVCALAIQGAMLHERIAQLPNWSRYITANLTMKQALGLCHSQLVQICPSEAMQIVFPLSGKVGLKRLSVCCKKPSGHGGPRIQPRHDSFAPENAKTCTHVSLLDHNLTASCVHAGMVSTQDPVHARQGLAQLCFVWLLAVVMLVLYPAKPNFSAWFMTAGFMGLVTR